MNFAEKEKQRKGVVGKLVGADAGIQDCHNKEYNTQVNTPEQKKKAGRPKTNRETKRRITLTLMPSNYEKAQTKAYNEGLSVSELIDDFLARYVNEQ